MRGVINFAMAFAVGLVVSVLGTVPAAAHGERNQEPFLRMRTLHWYDVKWSTDKLKVNEKLTITAKFRVFDDWPANMPKPDTANIGVGMPGPALARLESYINGLPVIQSNNLEVGRDYEIKLVMQGRVPGRHHIHPMVNARDAGAMVGPGQYIDVTGNFDDFVLPVATLAGVKIPNLENWNVQTVVNWHIVWFAVGLAWLLWWLRRPLLLPRHLAVLAGRESELVTKADYIAATVFLFGTIALVIFGFVQAERQYPYTIPLQGGKNRVDPLPLPDKVVEAKTLKANYDVPGRSMKITAQITNKTDRPIQLGEFTSASVRFINQAVPAAKAGVDKGYPADLLPLAGLKIDNNAPIGPGETRTLRLEAADVAWERERLTSLLRDPDSKFGAVLFFFDDQGQRHLANIHGPIIPIFLRADAR